MRSFVFSIIVFSVAVACSDETFRGFGMIDDFSHMSISTPPAYRTSSDSTAEPILTVPRGSRGSRSNREPVPTSSHAPGYQIGESIFGRSVEEFDSIFATWGSDSAPLIQPQEKSLDPLSPDSAYLQIPQTYGYLLPTGALAVDQEYTYAYAVSQLSGKDPDISNEPTTRFMFKTFPDEQCSICQEIYGEPEKNGARWKFTPISALNCSHYFHSGCLLTWFNQGSTRSCPICRQKWEENHI